MANFEYQARDRAGKKHKGTVDAGSVSDAARKLKAKQLFPVSIKPVKAKRGRTTPKEAAITFFDDLGGLLQSGVTVDRALGLIAAGETDASFKSAQLDILEKVQKGKDLSDALAVYPDLFGDLAPHLVRAGESSGKIGVILPWITNYLRDLFEFKKRLISSLIYPCILLGMSLVSVIVLVTYVLPKFAQIFNDLNQDPPVILQFMLDFGTLLTDWGWVLPIVFLAAWFGGKALLRDPANRLRLDKLFMRLPLFRTLFLQSDLNRFCSTLGIMLQSGVSMLPALRLVENVLGNLAVREEIAPLYREVKIGHSISSFFSDNNFFPTRLGAMIHIAEEQGRLAEGLIKLGEHYRNDFQQSLQRIIALIEPMVIIFTGAIIGVLVISMFTAIFGVNEVGF